jgi:hypothetical protein
MNERRFPWDMLAALIAGAALGLAYAWIISPVQVVDAAPEALRVDFKDQYRAVIAAAYASNGDLPRAQARLALLGDADSYQALSAQAQQMLAADGSPETVRQVAQLASALQGPAPTTLVVPSTRTKVATTKPSTSLAVTSASATAFETSTPFETETPIPFFTATARPTQTPIPPPAKPFELASQESVCDENLSEGLLQVITQTAARKQIPGVELILSWAGGEGHFFTGLKPELGNGYADYIMSPGVTYSLRAADGGTPITDLTPPACLAANGSTYFGGLLITLQRP